MVYERAASGLGELVAFGAFHMRAGFLGRYRCLAIDHEHVRGGLGPCATPLVGRASICVHVFRVTSLLELDFLDLRLL